MADRVVAVTLTARVNDYLANMEKARQKTKEAGSASEDASAKFEAQSQAMSEVGKGLLAIGAVALVGVGLAVKSFMDFDQAISNVKAATQESAENMSLLRDAALEAGASTVFTATEAANAIEELGKNGLTTAQILNGGLDSALSLASAGQIEVARAAEIAAITMKQFKLEASDLPKVADLLAAGAGKAAGDVDDLAAALSQAGLVASATGLSVEETTGVLSAFADAGLLGSDAGTSLKSALQRLTPISGESAAKMQELGISAFDTQGNFIGAAEFAGVLQSKLKGLTQEQRNAALAQIFGSDAVRAANVLYEQGADGIQKYIDQTNDSGYAAKVAADRLNNLSGDVERLGGAFDTVLIKSGSGANDTLRALTQGATGLVDAIGDLPAPVLGAAAGVTALVGVVALAGGTALVAVPQIAQFKLALATLNVSGASAARGIGLASGALALAGVAFSLWAARQAEATATTAEFKDSLDETTGAVTDYTRELVAKKLAEAGAFDAAKEAGVSQRELTDAVIEGGDALAEVQAKFSANNTLATFFTGVGVRAGNASQAMRDLSGNLAQSKIDLEDQSKAAGGSEAKTKDAATAYQDAASQADELNSNLQELIGTINEANGVGQDAVSANAQYQSALAGISSEVQRQRDEYEQLNGTLDGFTLSLDETTVSGSANASMLADVAGAAQDAAAKQFDLDQKTMSAKDATDKYAGTLEAQRQAFIDSATQAGFNADQVQILADKVFALPSEKEMNIIANTAGAITTLDQFISRYGTLSGTINYRATLPDLNGDVSGSGRPGFADGGLIPGAPSHKDNMLAYVASGEFVVNTRQAQKNRAALEYINRGGVIRGYAGGGEVQYARQSSSPVVNVAAPSLDGMQIRGTLDLGNGLVGFVDGRIAASSRSNTLRIQNGRAI